MLQVHFFVLLENIFFIFYCFFHAVLYVVLNDGDGTIEIELLSLLGALHSISLQILFNRVSNFIIQYLHHRIFSHPAIFYFISLLNFFVDVIFLLLYFFRLYPVLLIFKAEWQRRQVLKFQFSRTVKKFPVAVLYILYNRNLLYTFSFYLHCFIYLYIFVSLFFLSLFFFRSLENRRQRDRLELFLWIFSAVGFIATFFRLAC